MRTIIKQMKYALSLLIVMLFYSSNGAKACDLSHVGFDYFFDSLYNGGLYYFADTTVGVVSSKWDFGDGYTEDNSPVAHHAYLNDGTYNICLIVRDNNNCSDTICKTVSYTQTNNCDTSWIKYQYYIDTIHELHIHTGSTIQTNDIKAYLDGMLIAESAWARRGFIFFIYDSTGHNWQSYQLGNSCRGPYNDVNCSNFPVNVIEFITEDNDSFVGKRERQYLIKFLDSIPCGAYVMGYSFYNAGYSEWASDSINPDDITLFKSFENLGVNTIRQQEEYVPFAFFLQKCNTAVASIEIKKDTTGNRFAIIDTTFKYRDAIINEKTCRNQTVNQYYSDYLGKIYEIISLDTNPVTTYLDCDGRGVLAVCNSPFTNHITDSICNQVRSNLQFVRNIWTCSDTLLCDTVSCMLPGDADHDLTVNNFDVLAIGLSFNRTGNIRPNATTGYTLQSCPNWNTTHYYGYNDKFADCNGDGIINANDVLVINQNYIVQPENIFHHRQSSDSLPAITLNFDTLPTLVINGNCTGAEIVSDINVGSLSQITTDVYGIAFSVSYPFENDSCFSVQVELDANSWFQTNNPVLLFYKNIPEYKRVDISFVRTDGVSKTGQGKIGKIKLITEGDIFGFHRGALISYDFSVTNTMAINNTGIKKEINGSSTSVNFVTGIKQNRIEGLKVYPNPANSKIYISAKEIIESIRIQDMQGRIINEFIPNKYDVQLDISSTEQGLYIIEIKSHAAISYEKIFKQ